jgi:hypothetical protein
MKLLVTVNVFLDVVDQRPINFFISGRYWRKNGSTPAIYKFEEAYYCFRRDVIYNIHTEFGLARNLVGQIKMCLDEAYVSVLIGKYLSDKFRIKK